jgi:hypothetical protein
MKIKNYLSLIILLIVVVFACSPDDPDIELVPDRDRTEQQLTDKQLLLDYLETHYYNSGDLSNMVDATTEDIVITELIEGTSLPSNHTLLINSVESKTTIFEDTMYEYFILKINQGGGLNSPAFSDKVRVTYEGSLISDSSVFDSANSPTQFDLVGLNQFLGTISGWQRVFPNFNEAASFSISANGDVVYSDYGLGVMFLPSGLGYFSGALEGIPAYSNLIFKFTLFQTQENDHDNDGVPTYLEDLDGDLNAINDDNDEDLIANYVDNDDDNDGVLTINEHLHQEYVVDTTNGDTEPILALNEFEINRTEVNNVITINTVTLVDSNNDGVFDYLDAEIAINNNES